MSVSFIIFDQMVMDVQRKIMFGISLAHCQCIHLIRPTNPTKMSHVLYSHLGSLSIGSPEQVFLLVDTNFLKSEPLNQVPLMCNIRSPSLTFIF